MLVALPVVGLGEPAHAAFADLLCPFSLRIDLNPGITLAPQSEQIGGQANAGTSLSPLTPCSSLVSGVPYTGAAGPVTGTGTLSCVTVGAAGLTGGASGTVPLTFNNGDTSTIAWSVTVGGLLPVVTATFIGGALDGAALVLVPAALTGLSGNCVLAPIRSLTVVGLAVVVRL